MRLKLCNRMFKRFLLCGLIVLLSVYLSSCTDDSKEDPGPKDPPDVVLPPFEIDKLSDTYPALAPFSKWQLWGPYNTHDPSIVKDGEYFYCYSTDAAYGVDAPLGIPIKRSKDLVDWQMRGWALKALPTQGSNFIKSMGGTPFNSLWAPYIMKVENEFRLYYSLSSAKPRLSVIGLLVSDKPEGPWTERGLVVTSVDDASIQTNAIDPTVIIDKQGQHWMYYGSAWDGIYILKLNAGTGLAEINGTKGIRIAQRGFTGNSINGNIEGPEIIYNEEQDKYYLFIAYDWLETKYNVRVGRSDSPEGPFYDFYGNDLNTELDNAPMIIAPYKFQGHGGWQGTSHPSVFKDGDQYYIAHQGRPGVDKYYMVLHVRKLFWTEDGWPVASPERFANVDQTPVEQSELIGEWDRIAFGYQVVPGYAEEQLSPNFQESVLMILNDDGKINGDASNQWTYVSPWLTLTWGNGYTDKAYVSRERDWENKIETTVVFTGLNNEGTAVWGKKK